MTNRSFAELQAYMVQALSLKLGPVFASFCFWESYTPCYSENIMALSCYLFVKYATLDHKIILFVTATTFSPVASTNVIISKILI
jgi:hypothetical protein